MTDSTNSCKKIQFYESEIANAAADCDQNRKFDFFDFFPSDLLREPCMLGIDEAGRGPVLGPMVYACSICPVAKACDLKTLGLADSKTLSEQQRESLLLTMLSQTDWLSAAVHVISPLFITENMLDRCKTNLNTISHDSAIALINNALDKGINITQIFVDTVGKAEHYEAKLRTLFPTVQIRVESKADDTYPIVSAASIFAKVTRDRVLQMWPKSKRGPVPDDIPIGSGYPGDPLTKKYLEACVDPVLGFPSIVRSSWSTATNLMEKRCVTIRWEDDEDADKSLAARRLSRKREFAKGTCKLSDFFSSEDSSAKKAFTRQPYFTLCGLTHVEKIL